LTGGTVYVDRTDIENAERIVLNFQEDGFEVRALPDGDYRVIWIPPFPPEVIVEVTPPLQDVGFRRNETIRASVQTAPIRNASRVLDLEFTVRTVPVPSTGGVTLPDTGGGRSTSDAIGLAFAAALVLGFAAFGTLPYCGGDHRSRNAQV
jgi:hypothetical protein